MVRMNPSGPHPSGTPASGPSPSGAGGGLANQFGQSMAGGLGSGVGMGVGGSIGSQLVGAGQGGTGSGYGSQSGYSTQSGNGDPSGYTTPSGYGGPSGYGAGGYNNSSGSGNYGGTGGSTNDGSSIYNNHDSLVSSIEQAVESLGHGVIGQASSGGLASVVSFAQDPVGTLVSAGLDFLMQAVELVIEPLKQLEADPSAVQSSAQQFHPLAQSIKRMAQEHAQDSSSLSNDWQGDAADKYQAVSSRTSGQLASMGRVLEGAGNVTTSSGGLVSGLRNLVTKLISDLVERLIPGGVAALAAAPETFGASIPMFVAEALGVAVQVATEIASKISSLQGALGQVEQFFDQLGGLIDQLSNDLFGASGTSQNSDGSTQTSGYGTATTGSPDTNASGPTGGTPTNGQDTSGAASPGFSDSMASTVDTSSSDGTGYSGTTGSPSDPGSSGGVPVSGDPGSSGGATTSSGPWPSGTAAASYTSPNISQSTLPGDGSAGGTGSSGGVNTT